MRSLLEIETLKVSGSLAAMCDLDEPEYGTAAPIQMVVAAVTAPVALAGTATGGSSSPASGGGYYPSTAFAFDSFLQSPMPYILTGSAGGLDWFRARQSSDLDEDGYW